MNGRRLDPETLLSHVQEMERRESRGRLRIFLGMSPGVGKTYAMLRAAREQKAKGVDLAVGIVETHQRKETEALLDGLRILPRRTTVYKGVAFSELDLDLILKEKPRLILVDELAHSNAPGSRHAKRFQDVQELLEAGIDVYSTLNVQHIASRVDLVHEITGIQVNETVPDGFLDFADQIELIDLSPSELLKRLKDGKVYLGDMAERAAENFFKEEHLTALREIALRFTAETVDHELIDHMMVKQIAGPWNTNERLLVAISHSPYSQRLLRSTRRMAYNLEAPWVALYVDTGRKLSERDQEMLQKNFALARELGAEVVTTSDLNLVSAIRRVAAEKNVTQIIMGRPDRRFFQDLFSGGTLLDQFVKETHAIDVHVIRQPRKPRYEGFHIRLPKFHTGFFPYWFTLWFMIFVAFMSRAILPWVGYRAIGYVFLMAVLGVSMVAPLGPILFAALFSAFVWIYCFIPPAFTFVIASSDDIMMCIAYLLVALTTGILATRIRIQRELLLRREQRAYLLYEFGKRLNEARSLSHLCIAASESISHPFDGEVCVLVAETSAQLTARGENMNMLLSPEKDLAVVRWAYENKKMAGWSTDTLSASACLCMPLIGKTQAVGVLAFYPGEKQKPLRIEEENFLETICSQLAVALERELLNRRAQNAQVLAESEKLHQTLLNSVSHELRTPLTAIIGSATALQDSEILKSESSRNSLTQDLVISANRLNRVVENLLDMSRITSGGLQLKKEWFDLSELVDSALLELRGSLKDRQIKKLSTARDLFFEGDFKLLQHALQNILLNASQYSPEGSEIEVNWTSTDTKFEISVGDYGSGIPEEAKEKIFGKFYRDTLISGGIGLGLSIVRGILEAHKGSVWAENRAERSGAVFHLVLPRSDPPKNLTEIKV